MFNLPEVGGGEVIWTMPERNQFFLWEVVPYPSCPSQKILNYPTLHSQSFKVILKDYYWSIFYISLLQLVKVDDDLFVEVLVSQL